MSFFGEQLKYRKQRDDENFYDAVSSIAGAVMGTKLAGALSKKEIATSAIGEILAYFHHKPKYREIPDNIDTIDEQLEYCLRPFGIMRRRVELDKNWYRNAVGPMLGTFNGHAAALIPGKLSGYYCVDSSTGKRIKVNRKTAAHIDSDAMCFYKALPIKPLTSRDLFVYMLQQLKASDVMVFIGATAMATLLGMLGPVFAKWLVGDVLLSKSMQVLVSVGAFMIFYLLSRMLINVCKSFANARISTKQIVTVRAAVISRLISLPTSFFKGYSSGEVVKRAAYVRSVCTLIMNSLLSVGISSIFSLVYIGQIFAFAPSLVVPALLITLATFAVTLITALRQMKITREYMQLAAKTEGMTYSMITGIQKIKLAGAEKRMFSRWAKHYSEEAALEYNPPLFLKISPAILLGVSLFGTLILYAISIKTAVAATDYFAFNSCFAMVSAAFAELAAIATMIASVKPALFMAKPILETVPEMSEGKTAISSLSGNIELSHISFRYSHDMPNVIDDLSLKIKAGEYVAIVGSTGCGKSTLIRLLLGFEKPQKGAIYYDRRDLNQLDLKSLRRKIGTVMQDSKLFIGDIYSNIVITAPELTVDDAWEAAETASLAEDIRQMPMGMFTYISEGQGGISGGQKQRLMIARAVATKPKILILDEATSALDNITQKKVAEAIDKLKCTRIVIAHRLSTIKRCNRIVFLEGGKIVEDGTYDELIAQKGKFYELVERQRIEEN